MPKKTMDREAQIDRELALRRRAMEIVLGMPEDYELKLAVLARAEMLVRQYLDPSTIEIRKEETGQDGPPKLVVVGS